MLELALSLMLAADPPAAPSATDDAGAATAAPPTDPAPPELDAPEPRIALPDAGPAVPPELTGDGLQLELRRVAREHKSERAQIAAERAKLLKLAQDIDSARKLLRQETDALREKLKLLPEASEVPASALAPTPTPKGNGAAPASAAGGFDQLAKTLKGMKPQQAAQVLSRIERPLAIELLGKIKPGDRGEILDQMKPEEAAQLIAAMAPPKTPKHEEKP